MVQHHFILIFLLTGGSPLFIQLLLLSSFVKSLYRACLFLLSYFIMNCLFNLYHYKFRCSSFQNLSTLLFKWLRCIVKTYHFLRTWMRKRACMERSCYQQHAMCWFRYYVLWKDLFEIYQELYIIYCFSSSSALLVWVSDEIQYRWLWFISSRKIFV